MSHPPGANRCAASRPAALTPFSPPSLGVGGTLPRRPPQHRTGSGPARESGSDARPSSGRGRRPLRLQVSTSAMAGGSQRPPAMHPGRARPDSRGRVGRCGLADHGKGLRSSVTHVDRRPRQPQVIDRQVDRSAIAAGTLLGKSPSYEWLGTTFAGGALPEHLSHAQRGRSHIRQLRDHGVCREQVPAALAATVAACQWLAGAASARHAAGPDGWRSWSRSAETSLPRPTGSGGARLVGRARWLRSGRRWRPSRETTRGTPRRRGPRRRPPDRHPRHRRPARSPRAAATWRAGSRSWRHGQAHLPRGAPARPGCSFGTRQPRCCRGVRDRVGRGRCCDRRPGARGHDSRAVLRCRQPCSPGLSTSVRGHALRTSCGRQRQRPSRSLDREGL